MTVAFGEGRSFLYVLDKQTYNNSYYGKNHDKNLMHLSRNMEQKMKKVQDFREKVLTVNLVYTLELP